MTKIRPKRNRRKTPTAKRVGVKEIKELSLEGLNGKQSTTAPETEDGFGLHLKKGPSGNTDFVAHSSPEHAALLGFTDETLKETIFDTASLPAVLVDDFMNRRRRVLHAVPPKAPPGCPQMFDPEGLKDVEEVKLR